MAEQKIQSETVEVIDESATSQDFFQDNKSIMTENKCTTRRTKSRNYLTNIAYVGNNIEDFYNEIFIFDVYLLFTKK